MNFRPRAETLILLQYYEPYTDSKTLAEAVRIAWHER